jgi:hypothetical protein
MGKEFEIKNKTAAVIENIKLRLRPSACWRYKTLPQRLQNALPPVSTGVSNCGKSH